MITSKNPAACESAMNRFFALDKNERLPLGVTLHLLGCAECRTQVRMLSLAEKVAARPLKMPVSLAEADATRKTIERQLHLPLTAKNHVSLSNWIVGGVLMIAFMFAFVFLSKKIDSLLLTASFYLFFAGAVTAYCALFVGSNMDFFVKKIKTLQIAL